MKNKILLALTAFVLLGLTSYSPIHSQAATKSATATESSNLDLNLEDRLKKALDENLTKVKTLLDPNRKAVIGLVQTVASNSLKVTTNPGFEQTETLTINLTDQTEIKKVGKGVIKPEAIAIGDYVLALGSLQKDSLNATTITLDSYTAPTLTTRVLLATITKVDEKTKIISLKTTSASFDNLATSKAKLYDSQHQSITIGDLTTDSQVVVHLLVNSTNEKVTLQNLIQVNSQETPTPTATDTTINTCGDGICQNIVCQGIGCPVSEDATTCPADCQEE